MNSIDCSSYEPVEPRDFKDSFQRLGYIGSGFGL